MAQSKTSKRSGKAKTTNDRFVEQPGLMSNVRRAPGLGKLKRTRGGR